MLPDGSGPGRGQPYAWLVVLGGINPHLRRPEMEARGADYGLISFVLTFALKGARPSYVPVKSTACD